MMRHPIRWFLPKELTKRHGNCFSVALLGKALQHNWVEEKSIKPSFRVGVSDSAILNFKWHRLGTYGDTNEMIAEEIISNQEQSSSCKEVGGWRFIKAVFLCQHGNVWIFWYQPLSVFFFRETLAKVFPVPKTGIARCQYKKRYYLIESKWRIYALVR